MDNNNKHEEIMFKLGKIEGGIDAINAKLLITNGRLDKHSERINTLEDFNIGLKAKVGTISAVVGGVVGIIGFIVNKFL